jgi:predicted membrane protein
MHPISFVKAHPVGTIVSALAGMMIGPWVLNMVNSATGVGVSIPSVGGN